MLGSFVFSMSVQAKQPNVLLLMADDLNTALSGYGHTQCKTPQLDKLAKRGVRFDGMHCQYPVCGASRASMMTGLYPYTNGMLGNSGDLRANLPDVVTLSQLFRNNGYHVGRVSKIFHMGIPREIIAGTAEHDDAHSWDEVVNIQAPEQHVEGVSTIFSPLNETSQTFEGVVGSGGDLDHADGLAAAEAVQFLERNVDKPFFLACGFVRPHVPLVAPQKYFDLYDRSSIKLPEVIEGDLEDIPKIIRGYKRNSTTYGITPELHQGLLQAYYASVSYMDAQVGVVLDKLDVLGLSENTIVIFTSDHGYLLGEHYKFQKQHLFEEATRVPFLLRVPWLEGEHGSTVNQLTELVDLYPTIAELAGLTPPDGLQGYSFVDLLQDVDSEKWPRKDVFTISRSGGGSLRTNGWRYTHWGHGEKGQELYNLSEDPRELHNLINEKTDKGQLKLMQERLNERRLDAGFVPK